MSRNRREYIIYALKRRIWRERQIWLLLLLLLLAFTFYQRWANEFYVFKVNGAAVVWAKSRKAAQEIERSVKEKQGAGIPANVNTRFAQSVKIERAGFTGDEIPDLQEATEKLSAFLNLMVVGPVIMVDDKPIVGVPSQEIAQLVRKEIMRKLAPTGTTGEVILERFKEKVEPKNGEVPVNMFRSDTKDAVDLLTGKGRPGAPGKPYVTVVSVIQELERGGAAGGGAPARMVKVTYENGKEMKREPLE